MATSALVDTLINDGKRVIQALDDSGFQLHSAFWYYVSESDRWLFMLATPTIDEKGPTRTYSEIQRVLKRVSPVPAVSLKDISVISPKHDLVRLLRMAIRTGSGISDIRFSRNTVNGVFIPDAYIYRVQ